jgi:hypothetical protein
MIDAEEKRFKFNPDISGTTIQFKFSGSFQSNFINAGFTQNEINQNSNNLLNSFFILDFYDTYNVNTQIKIFTTYLTKVGKIPTYLIDNDNKNQLYCLYVPISYISGQTGTTVTGYTKFSFFNAKSGTTTLFYNEDNENFTTPERLFFKTELNLTGNTWRIITASYPTIKAKEIVNNALYVNRINSTYDNINNLQQTYPTGDTLIQSGGTNIYVDSNKTTSTTSGLPVPTPPPAPEVYYLLSRCGDNNSGYYTTKGNSSVLQSGNLVQSGSYYFHVVYTTFDIPIGKINIGTVTNLGFGSCP